MRFVCAQRCRRRGVSLYLAKHEAPLLVGGGLVVACACIFVWYAVCTSNPAPSPFPFPLALFPSPWSSYIICPIPSHSGRRFIVLCFAMIFTAVIVVYLQVRRIDIQLTQTLDLLHAMQDKFDALGLAKSQCLLG